METISPTEALELARDASEAIRALNHATHPADMCPGLRYPADAYDLLGSLHQLAYRLPQLLTQIDAFLQRHLRQDLITIDGGEHAGHPREAIGLASHELDCHAAEASRRLAGALDAAQQAIAFASRGADVLDDDA